MAGPETLSSQIPASEAIASGLREFFTNVIFHNIVGIVISTLIILIIVVAFDAIVLEGYTANMVWRALFGPANPHYGRARPNRLIAIANQAVSVSKYAYGGIRKIKMHDGGDDLVQQSVDYYDQNNNHILHLDDDADGPWPAAVLDPSQIAIMRPKKSEHARAKAELIQKDAQIAALNIEISELTESRGQMVLDYADAYGKKLKDKMGWQTQFLPPKDVRTSANVGQSGGGEDGG